MSSFYYSVYICRPISTFWYRVYWYNIQQKSYWFVHFTYIMLLHYLGKLISSSQSLPYEHSSVVLCQLSDPPLTQSCQCIVLSFHCFWVYALTMVFAPKSYSSALYINFFFNAQLITKGTVFSGSPGIYLRQSPTVKPLFTRHQKCHSKMSTNKHVQ